MQVMNASELAELFTRVAKENPRQPIGIDYTFGSAVARLYPALDSVDIFNCLKNGRDIAEVDRMAERISKAKEKYN